MALTGEPLAQLETLIAALLQPKGCNFFNINTNIVIINDYYYY